MADDVKFTGDPSSLVRALDKTIKAQQRFMQSLTKIDKISKGASQAIRAYQSIVKQEAETTKAAAAASVAASKEKATATRAAADQQIAVINNVARQTEVAANKEIAALDLKRTKNDNYAKNLATRANKEIELGKLTAREAEANARKIVSAEATKQEARKRSAQKLKTQEAAENKAAANNERLAALAKKRAATENKLTVQEKQRLALINRTNNALEHRQKLERMARAHTYKKQIEETRELHRAQREARQSIDGMLAGWKGLIRIMTVSIGYRAFYGLIRQIQDGARAALEFQRAVAGVRTISQEANMSAREWADGLQRVSDGWRLDIIEQTEAAYQSLTNQVVQGRDAFEFLETSNRFATAALIETNQAVRLVTAAINAYGYAASDAERLYESFFKTIELGRIRGGEMTEMGRIFMPARTLGVEINELNAAMATLTRQGVQPGEAMMFLRNIMMALIKPTDTMKEYFAELGVNTGQAAIESMNFIGLLRKMEDRFKGSASDLGKLFGRIRAMTGAFGLQGSALELLEETYAKLNEETDNYNNAVKTMTSTSSEKLAISLSKIRNVFIRLGSDATDALASMTDGYDYLYRAGKEFALILRSSVVPAIFAATAATIKFGLAMLATPIGAITAAIAAISYGYVRVTSASRRAEEAIKESINEELRARREQRREIDRLADQAGQRAVRQRKAEFQAAVKGLDDQVAAYNRLVVEQADSADAAAERVEEIGKAIKNTFSDAIKESEKDINRLTGIFDSMSKKARWLDPKYDATLFNWELEKRDSAEAIDFIKNRINTISGEMTASYVLGDIEGWEKHSTALFSLIDQLKTEQDKIIKANKKTEEERRKLNQKLLDAEDKYHSKKAKLLEKADKGTQKQRAKAIQDLEELERAYTKEVTELGNERDRLKRIEIEINDVIKMRTSYLKQNQAQAKSMADAAEAQAKAEAKRVAELKIAESRAGRLIKIIDSLTLKDIYTGDFTPKQLTNLANEQAKAYEELGKLSTKYDFPIDRAQLFLELEKNQEATVQRLVALEAERRRKLASDIKNRTKAVRQELNAEKSLYTTKMRTLADELMALEELNVGKRLDPVRERMASGLIFEDDPKDLVKILARYEKLLERVKNVDSEDPEALMNAIGSMAELRTLMQSMAETVRLATGDRTVFDPITKLLKPGTDEEPGLQRIYAERKAAVEGLQRVEELRRQMLERAAGQEHAIIKQQIEDLSGVEEKLRAIKQLEQDIIDLRVNNNSETPPALRPLQRPDVNNNNGNTTNIEGVSINLNATGNTKIDARAIANELKTLSRQGLA